MFILMKLLICLKKFVISLKGSYIEKILNFTVYENCTASLQFEIEKW